MASSISVPAPALAPATVDYPSSDGKPMAESDAQRIPLTYAVDRLRHHFRSDPDVYVSGDLLIYYEENSKRRVAPDVFVVFGARDRVRPSYKLWEEPKAPDFVLEITSPKTWRRDQRAKRRLYRRLGVREYWQYDPTGDYLVPSLQGLELVAGEYEMLPEREVGAGTLAVRSEVLGLELRLVDRGLRFHDPRTGKDLPDLSETDDQREEAEARAELEAEGRRREAEGRREEAAARQVAETRVQQEAAARQAAETRFQQEAAARQAAETRFQQEAAARQAAETRFQQEVAARKATEARLAELEALLRRGPDGEMK